MKPRERLLTAINHKEPDRIPIDMGATQILRFKLLIGYIWKTESYPWINFWRDKKNGDPQAFGMENIYEFIDAGEIVKKSFVGFTTKIPDNYQGVEQIKAGKTSFTLKERAKESRDITFQITIP